MVEHTLKDILKEEISWYAVDGSGANVRFVKLFDEAQNAYSVLAFPQPKRNQAAFVVVMARIHGDFVIIEEDNTDRPLEDALTYRGIPREKIILRYAGETVPESAGV